MATGFAIPATCAASAWKESKASRRTVTAAILPASSGYPRLINANSRRPHEKEESNTAVGRGTFHIDLENPPAIWLPSGCQYGAMTTENAIRWLAHESKECRDRDSCEAFCLLLPALLRVLALDAMHEAEAAAFRHEFKQRLNLLPFQDATNRALARPVLFGTLNAAGQLKWQRQKNR